MKPVSVCVFISDERFWRSHCTQPFFLMGVSGRWSALATGFSQFLVFANFY